MREKHALKPVPGTREALRELARYGNTEVAAALTTLGERAIEVVPECVGLSLALREEGLTFTLAATSEEAAVLDAIQYVDGGPCVDDLERGEVLAFKGDDPLDEDRWSMYSRATAAAGVASSLSLPIIRDGRVVGGINVYASTRDAFDGRHDELADAVGGSAQSAVSNADLGFTTRRMAALTPGRLVDRHDIDVAVGIIVSRQGVDAETAESRLRQAADRAGVTCAQAARTIAGLFDA